MFPVKKEKEESSLPTPEQAAKIVADQARAAERYNWTVMAHFLCRHHKVRDVSCIRPFGANLDAWSLMRTVVLGAELGSPVQTAFQYDLSANGEQQAVTLHYTSDKCRLLCSPLPIDPFKHPTTGKVLDVDVDHVYVYRMTCRHASSSVPVHQGARLNFYHNGMPTRALREADEMRAAASGCVRGEFLDVFITPPEGVDISDCTPVAHQDYGALSAPFISTMALINESNLMNGIIDVPHEVCLAARLPVSRTMDMEEIRRRGAPEPSDAELELAFSKISIESAEQRESIVQSIRDNKRAAWERALTGVIPMRSFKAIPTTHVLAWWMCSSDFARSANMEGRYEEFTFVPVEGNPGGLPVGASMTLYFFLGDVYFDRMVAEFRATWMNVLDVRPLSSIAVELVPKTSDRARYYPDIDPSVTRVCGSTVLLTYLSYCVAPRLSAAQIASLAPTRHPQFRPSGDYVPDSTAQQMIDDALKDKLVRTAQEK